MESEALYTRPRTIESADECEFYHAMDLPGVGPIDGAWDLRAGVREYLGGLEPSGKRVLDVGTASGFLAFWMEGAGADVVGYDLSEEQDWDLVPYAGVDPAVERAARKEHIRRLNNSFWFAHRALGSAVKLAQGSVYEIPAALGAFDVAVFGSILLHLRDPFRALERALALTRETAVVTDVLPRRAVLVPVLARWLGPTLEFLPDASRGSPTDSWFRLSPHAVVRMLGVLGFVDSSVSFHRQLYGGVARRLFTVVARRPMRA
jgi:SAM-dependent methyltransferase